MSKKFIYGLQELPKVVGEINKQLEDVLLLTLEGSLGAGKTTLVKALLEGLGVNPDEVTSPTFTYVNAYKLPSGKKVYHFDLYRVTNVDHFIEMGFDEYLEDKNAIILIEWPEVIKNILPQHLVAKIDYEGPEEREITLEVKS